MCKKKRRQETRIDAQRWAAYAIAGLATTTGMQATTEADIIVEHPNFNLLAPSSGTYAQIFLGFQSGSGNYLNLYHALSTTNVGRMNVIGSGSVFIAGSYTNLFYYPTNAAYGANISTLSFYIPPGGRGDMAWGTGAGTNYPYSNFVDSGTSYLAFRFQTAAGTQYGWAEVVMDNNKPINSGVLTRYAFTTEGESLAVGQIPEAGAMGLLAWGSIGLMLWRRNRGSRMATES